jgi:hypothetical protein
MIELLTHLMFGIAIGAYLFNSKVRSGVNDIVKKIAVGLYTALANYNNSKQQRPTAKRATTSAPKQERIVYQQDASVKSLYRSKGICDKCGAPIVILEEGVFKGSGICTKCNAFVAAIK